MKNAVALTFVACLAVHSILGCCVYRPAPIPTSGPTPTPTPSPTPGIPPIVVDPTLPPQKFAVLATNLQAEVEDNQLESDFWYDLVLTYCTLLDHGFKKENVFVLYGGGSDAAFSSIPAYKTHLCGVENTVMTDFSLQKSTGVMAKDNLCNVLCCLSTGYPAEMNNDICACLPGSDTGLGGFTCSQTDGPAKLRETDFLFAWVKGHGKTTSCNTTLRFTPNPHLHDGEVAALLKDLESKHKALVFETCDAGGWLGSLQNANTAVLVSSGDPDNPPNDCEETAWAFTYDEIPGDGGGVFHGRFTHGFNAALRQINPVGSEVDGDDNNLISIQESFTAAMARINAENAIIEHVPAIPGADALGESMHPAIQIPDGIASCLFIQLPNPGRDHEVFTKDHEEDNALVPSGSGTPPSPDLWVRKNEDTVQASEPAKTGADNHLFARVHNIGCDDPGKIVVKFFVKSCDILGSGTMVAQKEIIGLPAATSDIAHALWPKNEVPAANDYCLTAELWMEKDPLADGTDVDQDNNKAMIMITVEN